MTSHNPLTHARMHRDTPQRHVVSASSPFPSFLLHVLIKTILHKPSRPLRPVVATCGTLTYALSKSLAAILKHLVGYSGRIPLSTSDLIEVMKTVIVSNDELLVSYDVKSLFTSIPVGKESVEVCENRLRKDIKLADRTSLDVETKISLLRFCLTSTSFQYGGEHFIQVDGVAMGSPVFSTAILQTSFCMCGLPFKTSSFMNGN